MPRDTTPDPADEPRSRTAPTSNGPNVRPRNAAVGQSGRGEPDDASRRAEIDPAEEAAVARKILERPPEPGRG